MKFYSRAVKKLGPVFAAPGTYAAYANHAGVRMGSTHVSKQICGQIFAPGGIWAGLKYANAWARIIGIS